MITRLEASRYRCFERLAIDTASDQVLVGANGSGESTLPDLPLLLGDLLRQRRISDASRESRGHRPPRATTLAELVFLQRGSPQSFIVDREHLTAFPMTAAYVADRRSAWGDSVSAAGGLRILERSGSAPAFFTRLAMADVELTAGRKYGGPDEDAESLGWNLVAERATRLGAGRQ